MYDVTIIGGGVAAFAAGLYAGRFRLRTLVIGEKLGGTVLLTNEICNYPGFETITGLELFRRIKDHATGYGIEVLEKRAEAVEKDQGGFKVTTDGQSHQTRTLIFATGTRVRKLGVPGEQEYAGKGVHYCALCDGAFYQDQVIAVVGGSDSAATEALLLAEYGREVYIIYRRQKVRAEPVTLERVRQNKKIEVINNTNVTQIKGEQFVTAVVLDRPYRGSNELALDAVFIQIGQIPLSDLAVSLGVLTNENKEIITDKDARTNIPGVFACGDVTASEFKQAITSVAQGVTAAHSAYRHITSETLLSH